MRFLSTLEYFMKFYFLDDKKRAILKLLIARNRFYFIFNPFRPYIILNFSG